MNDTLFNILTRLWRMRHLERLVTPSGGFKFIGLLSIAAAFVPYQIEARWYWCIIVPLATALCLAVFWYAAREAYWRTGRGRKIGICYEGYQVPIDDWVEMRCDIARLVEDAELDENICVRLVPVSVTRTPKAWKRFEKKYSFSLLFRVQHSPLAEDPKKYEMHIQLRTSFRQMVDRKFLEATNQHSKKLLQGMPDRAPSQLRELLRYRASSLFHVVLLQIAVVDVADGKHRNASRLLTALDASITHFRIDEHPRKAIRWLDAICRVDKSHYSSDEVPIGDELVDVASASKDATCRYGSEFPFVFNLAARDQFFLGNPEVALNLTESGLANTTNKLSGMPLACAILNRAVLNLFLGRWDNAADGLRAFFSMREASQFNWDDLVNFADEAAVHYDSAVFLRALYRKYRGPSSSTGALQSTATDWMNADESRQRLRGVYRDIRTLGQPVARPPKANHKRKKRNKRR